MNETYKINDSLYVVSLGRGKVQLRTLIKKDEGQEEWKCTNLSRQDADKLMTFLRNEILYRC